MSSLRTALPLALILAACKGEPTTSYCESVCDWAVSCAATERPVDAAALEADCLAATRAADEGCAKAEEGTLDPATRAALQSCTDAITAAADAGECDGFAGSIDDLKTATAPTECAATGTDVQAVFGAAQSAVAETGEQLCNRFTETFCARLDECVIADLGTIPQPVIDELGTPYELCVARLDVQTQSCVTQDLYAEAESLADANPTRESARECLRDFGAQSCDALLAGELSEICGGSFASAEDSIAFATALFETAQDIQEAVEAANGTGMR